MESMIELKMLIIELKRKTVRTMLKINMLSNRNFLLEERYTAFYKKRNW